MRIVAKAEAAFFHLHNIVTQSGALLVTATTPPRDWGLALPDLASVLSSQADPTVVNAALAQFAQAPE